VGVISIAVLCEGEGDRGRLAVVVSVGHIVEVAEEDLHRVPARASGEMERRQLALAVVLVRDRLLPYNLGLLFCGFGEQSSLVSLHFALLPFGEKVAVEVRIPVLGHDEGATCLEAENFRPGVPGAHLLLLPADVGVEASVVPPVTSGARSDQDALARSEIPNLHLVDDLAALVLQLLGRRAVGILLLAFAASSSASESQDTILLRSADRSHHPVALAVLPILVLVCAVAGGEETFADVERGEECSGQDIGDSADALEPFADGIFSCEGSQGAFDIGLDPVEVSVCPPQESGWFLDFLAPIDLVCRADPHLLVRIVGIYQVPRFEEPHQLGSFFHVLGQSVDGIGACEQTPCVGSLRTEFLFLGLFLFFVSHVFLLRSSRSASWGFFVIRPRTADRIYSQAQRSRALPLYHLRFLWREFLRSRDQTDRAPHTHFVDREERFVFVVPSLPPSRDRPAYHCCLL